MTAAATGNHSSAGAGTKVQVYVGERAANKSAAKATSRSRGPDENHHRTVTIAPKQRGSAGLPLVTTRMNGGLDGT